MLCMFVTELVHWRKDLGNAIIIVWGLQKHSDIIMAQLMSYPTFHPLMSILNAPAYPNMLNMFNIVVTELTIK